MMQTQFCILLDRKQSDEHPDKKGTGKGKDTGSKGGDDLSDNKESKEGGKGKKNNNLKSTRQYANYFCCRKRCVKREA